MTSRSSSPGPRARWAWMGTGRHRGLAQRARGPGEELLEVILLLGGLDPLVVDDEVVGDDQLVMGVVTQKGRVNLLLLHTKLLTHLCDGISVHNAGVRDSVGEEIFR